MCSKCKNGQGKYKRNAKSKARPCPRCQPKPSPDAINVRGRWHVPAS